MLRILLFSAAGFAIFAGFAAPFVLGGVTGLIAGASLIIPGAVALWLIDRQTKRRLEKDSALNRLMKADGEDLLPRDSD